VLDDLDLKNEEINSHLVKTNAQVGITEDDAMSVLVMISYIK
jgi:hypothetical protein